MNQKLKRSFFIRNNVNTIARQLLGKVLCTHIENRYSSGIITEVEAYGCHDRACHAYENKRTKRTEVMFKEGGHSYVYLCYGIHHLFNIVTNRSECPEAILIRSVEPLDGVGVILDRRNQQKTGKTTSSGPGVVSKALGIGIAQNGVDLTTSPNIWLEDRQILVQNEDIHSTTRIGIDYAGKDALLPWRYYIKDSLYISKI